MEHGQADWQWALWRPPIGWSFNDLGLVITHPYYRPPILSLFGCETPSLPLPAGLVGSKALGCFGEECSAGEEPGNLYLEDCDSGGQLVLWVVGEAWRRRLTLVWTGGQGPHGLSEPFLPTRLGSYEGDQGAEGCVAASSLLSRPLALLLSCQPMGWIRNMMASKVCCLLGIPVRRLVGGRTECISQCDLIWKLGLHRCNQMKMSHTGLGWALNPVTGVLIRRGRFVDRHTGRETDIWGWRQRLMCP